MKTSSQPGPPTGATVGQLRGTTFCFIVYKEDLPPVGSLFPADDESQDLRDLISCRVSALGYSGLISPEHDPDNECKKTHYHVMVNVVTQMTVNRAKGLFLGSGACFGGGGTVFVVNNPVGYTRYLCHLDDLDKQQWDEAPEELILCFGGAKIILSDSKAENRNRIMTEIEEIIIDYNITSWISLLKHLNPEQRQVARGYATYLHYLVQDMMMYCKAKDAGACGEAGYYD